MRSEQKMVAFFVYYGFISALLIIWTSGTLSEHANDTIKIVIVSSLLLGAIFAIFGAENKEKKGEK